MSKFPIPEIYPTSIEECLKIVESIRYESYGFPVFFLDYNYTLKCWSCSFRNPQKFSDPSIKAKTPLEAIHTMFDFLKTLPVKQIEKENITQINPSELKIESGILPENKFILIDSLELQNLKNNSNPK